MSGILTDMETAIIAKLAPLVGSVTATGFRVETFQSADDISALLAAYKDITPAGFLSVPTITFNAQGTTRVSDFTADYSLLIGYATDRDSHDSQRTLAYTHFSVVTAALQFSQDVSAAGYRLDFTRLSRWQFIQSANAVAAIFGFSIRASRVS